MMVTARREKRRLSPVTLRHLEPQDVAIKFQRPLEIGHLQVNVADANAGINRFCALGIHGRQVNLFQIRQHQVNESRLPPAQRLVVALDSNAEQNRAPVRRNYRDSARVKTATIL